MAGSQDFEARRRERLKMQHKKRERERRIQRIIFLIAVAFLAFLLIFNIVKCAKKPDTDNQPAVTQVPYEEDTDAKFDPSIPNPQEGRNSYLDIIKESGEKNHAYLTFDNGPSEAVTPAILDVVRRYNVKATCFMNGKDIKDNPYLCTRAIEEGHLVLPLSKSGNSDILYADKTTFMDEIEETYDLIVENTPSGEKPIKLYRFLGGSYSNTSYGSEKERYKDVLAENGYYYCDWNASVGDSNASRSAEQLLNYYKTNKPSVNNLVIQLNNKDENTATPKMLGNLIEQLLSDGYTIGSLDDIEFINEIKFEDDEPKTEKDDDDTSSSTDKPASTTKVPESTKKPQSTKAPETTKKPESTKAPEATKKPESTKAPSSQTTTQTPTKATLAPSSGDEITSE